MFKSTLLKLHRWLTLLFALPLAVVIVTGLIFAFEPMLMTSNTQKGDVTLEKVNEALAVFDKDGKVGSLSYSPISKILTLHGVGDEGETEVNMVNGEEAETESALVAFLQDVKRIHQRLVYDLGWLVTASSFAMLILMVLGVFMGLPRLRNSLSGWHKGVAWFGLPLLVLSPLTGLFLTYGISFNSPPPREAKKPVTIKEAVEIVSKSQDLSGLIWIRSRGGNLIARINDGGTYKTLGVSHEKGAVEGAKSWPRLLHEGNWGGYFSAGLNALVGLALTMLLVTGLWMWARRNLRMRKSAKAKANTI